MIITKKWQHKGKRKYYAVCIMRDLFGDISVLVYWGSLTSRLGNYKIYGFKSLKEVKEKMNAISKRRIARGYEACH